MLIPICIACA